MKWQLAYAHHEDCYRTRYCTIADLEQSGFALLLASVPGNLELDMMRD